MKSNQGSSVIAIVFFNPISEDFPRKLTNATYPNVKIEVCVDNIGEFLSIIKTCLCIDKCNLEKCPVKLFLKGLESYGENLRKSSRLLRKNFTDLCDKYPTGFRYCIAIAQNKHFIMNSRSNNNSN